MHLLFAFEYKTTNTSNAILVTLDNLETAIESLNLDGISLYDFKEFWQ